MTDENLQNAENEAEAATANQENEENPNLEADDGQNKDEGETHAEENAARPNKVPAGKRIRQLTRKWRDAERENDALKQRLDALEKRIGPAPEPVRPNRDDFDSDTEYEDALFDWRDNVKALKSESESKPDVPASNEVPQVVTELESELEQLGDDAVMAVMEDDWPCNPGITEYIMASDIRANLAYHLATHHDIAEKVANMSPILAARELSKIEDELRSSSNVNNSAQNDINAPPPPLDTNTPSSVSMNDQDKMSTDQWTAMRRKQMAERAR